MESPAANNPLHPVPLPSSCPCKLLSWNVAPGDRVHKASILGSYSHESSVALLESRLQLKSSIVGLVKECLVQPGDVVQPGTPVIVLEENCDHSIVVFDMCADCGMNLRRHPNTRGVLSQPVAASVSMIHGIPEIRVSQKEAELLGRKDKLRLLGSRKLALVVDLDQTLIHTSVDHNIQPGLPDVYGFSLPGYPMIYHCRLRPHARQFLQKVSVLYELHVFTMGTKSYAASVTHILDPERKLFCDRIISRDECFDPNSKALRLKSVFPCGDSMVAIIDDREDVWGRCPNLIHVKPYVFFAGTADINAPPPPTPHTPTTPHTPSTPHGHPFPPPHAQQQRYAFAPLPSEHAPMKTRQLSRPNEREFRTHPPSRNPGSLQRTISRGNDSEAVPAPTANETERTESDTSAAVAGPRGTGGSGRLTPLESLLLAAPGESGENYDRDARPSSQEHLEVQGLQPQLGDQTAEDSTKTVTCAAAVIDSGGNTNVNNNNGSDGDPADGSGPKGDREKEGGSSSSSNSSSSSDSDNEDSSSSGSSGIDNSLFEQLGEGEGEGEGEELPWQGQEVVEEEERHESTAVWQQEEKDRIEEKMDTGTGVAQPEPVEQKADRLGADKQTERRGSEDKQRARKRVPEIHDPDDFLLHLGDILERIHTTFFAQFDEMSKGVDLSPATNIPTPDLKRIIPKMRQSVLKGAKIIFTGVIPTNMPPERSAEWNTARAFGATVHSTIVPGLNSPNPKLVVRATTHVVVGKPGTSKLKDARKTPGMKVVNSRWLWSCAERWRWLNEKLFPVEFAKTAAEAGIEERKKRDEDEEPQRKISKTDNSGEAREQPEWKETDSAQAPRLSESSITSKERIGSGSKKVREIERHMSLESRLSVSDEELEKMQAEVDAELGSESSSSSEDGADKERLGSFIEEQLGDENEQSYEQFAGDVFVKEPPSLATGSRKRKHADVENSSASNSPSSNSVENAEQSEGSGSESDGTGDDELAALLEGDAPSGSESD